MEMDKDQKLSDLFAKARKEAPIVGFEEMKNSFSAQMARPSARNSIPEASQLFTIKTWTIMITTLLTVAIGAYFMVGNAPVKEDQNTKNEMSLTPMRGSKKDVFLAEMNAFSFPERTNAEVYIPEFSSTEEIERVTPPILTQVAILDTVKTVFSDSEGKENPYRFPVLSEEEKKMYAKHKAKMIKQLIKRDKKMYAFIPAGTIAYEEDTVSIRPFHMQITEVTNLQYRTFLFDLLEQGRRSDFLESKPDQSLWAKDYPEYNQPLVELYFSHPAYNDYPVNNISRLGAELFGTWLTNQANEVMNSKGKPAVNDVRLPSVFEWVYAANGGKLETPYPWGGPYNRNSKGCYLANFNPDGESADEDGAMHTAKVSSYSPNGYGLYCMSGNLAEMVYYSQDKSQPGTKGGSFLSSSENIQINGKDEFKGITAPNVNIGFRVVISYGIVGIAGIKDME